MKKKSIIQITLFTTLLFNHSFAQEGKLKLKNPFEHVTKTTTLGAMYSIPVGKFSSTNLEDGGFAKAVWGLYFDSKSTFKSGISFLSHSTFSWVPITLKEPLH